MERTVFGIIMIGVVGFVLASVTMGCSKPETEPQVIIVGSGNNGSTSPASSMSFRRLPNGTIEFGSASLPVVVAEPSPERVGCTYDRVDDVLGCVPRAYRVSDCGCDVNRASDDRSERAPVTVNVTQNNGSPATTSTSQPHPVPAPRPVSTCHVPPPVSSASCR